MLTLLPNCTQSFYYRTTSSHTSTKQHGATTTKLHAVTPTKYSHSAAILKYKTTGRHSSTKLHGLTLCQTTRSRSTTELLTFTLLPKCPHSLFYQTASSHSYQTTRSHSCCTQHTALPYTATPNSIVSSEASSMSAVFRCPKKCISDNRLIQGTILWSY